jgi:hypothetical protein
MNTFTSVVVMFAAGPELTMDALFSQQQKYPFRAEPVPLFYQV